MQETRHRFHAELEALEGDLFETGQLSERAVGRAVDALLHRDAAMSLRVIDEDDLIDGRYLDIERRVLDVLALQTPVASDLRLISVVLHCNLHLERVGDMAVNIAKMALATEDLARDETILSHLREMSDIVRRMIETALDSLVRRDLQLCLRLPAMDDPVDELNRGMYRQVVRLAGDPRALEWGVQMVMVARQLERVGDHAVDIAEQVGFLLTGEFREFTDASHEVRR